MGMIAVTGERGNILEGIVSAPVSSPVDLTNFPATRLYGRVPSSFWMQSAVGPNSTVTFDGNEVTNGGAESGAAIAPWVDDSVAGSFTSVTATPTPQVGSRNFKASVTSGGSNTGSGHIDIRVKAGQKKTLTIGMITDSASRTARLKIQNLNTGNYLVAGGASWQSASTDVLTRANVAYGTQTVTFTIENLATSKADTVTLRLTCYVNQAGGTGYAGFDECYMFSWPDTAMISGFLNLTAGITVELHSSTDNFGANDTTRGTFTIPQLLDMSPAQWITFTQYGDRWHRLKFVGTPPAALYGGQAALFQKLTLTQPQEYGFQQEWTQAQVRSSVRAYRLEDAPTRAYALEFTEPSVGAYNEQRDAVIGASEMGYHPIILIPVDTEDVVIYGRIDPTVKMVRKFLNQWTTTYRLEELPHPTVTNA